MQHKPTHNPEKDTPHVMFKTIKTAAAIVLAAFACVLMIPTAAHANVNSHIVGAVYDDVTSDPIAGVVVTVSRAGGPSLTVSTDGTGFYNVGNIPAGVYNVRFVDPSKQHMTEYNGGTPTSTGATAVNVYDNTTTPVDAGLAPAAVLSGSVTDANNVPVVGAKARILKPSPNAPYWAAYVTLTSDINGNWVSAPVPIGTYKIRYEAAGFKAQYNDNVPTVGTSGLAAADPITPAPYVVNVVPTAVMLT